MNLPIELLDLFSKKFSILFSWPSTKKRIWLNRIWIGVLFIIGVLAWGHFFSWGNFSPDFHDWADITAPRFQFLKNAAKTLQFPLHISHPSALNYLTTRYLAIPDSFIAPQFILLRRLNVQTFSLANLFIFYILGFWGTLIVRKRFKLSPAAFTLLFLLFNFNGHIVAHVSVGHETWSGYFLFPFFVLLILDLLDGDHTWRWVGKIALLLFVMFINGSFHQFVWCILFLCLTAIFVPRTFWFAIKGIIFACMASLFKILPPVIQYGNFDNTFFAGYPTVGSLWDALVAVQVPADLTNHQGMTNAFGTWELTLYIGLLGAIFLLIFGVFQWLRRTDDQIDRGLALPLISLTALSLAFVYENFRLLRIPLFDGERVSTRLLSLVFVFVLIIAVHEYQRWLNNCRKTGWLTGGLAIGTGLIAQDLWQFMKLWQIQRAGMLFESKGFASQDWFVANDYTDHTYLLMVAVGFAASVITFVFLSIVIFRERRPIHLNPSSSLKQSCGN